MIKFAMKGSILQGINIINLNKKFLSEDSCCVLKDTFDAKVFINVCICGLATYFGSLVTQFLANLDVLVYPNKRCRRAYTHISLKRHTIQNV
jgi:hypothetical protein